jgi:hypothetical protein
MNPPLDVVQSCLSLAPVPYLHQAVSSFRYIYVQRAQASKLQLRDLEQGAAQLLLALNDTAQLQSSPNTVYSESPHIKRLDQWVLAPLQGLHRYGQR